MRICNWIAASSLVALTVAGRLWAAPDTTLRLGPPSPPPPLYVATQDLKPGAILAIEGDLAAALPRRRGGGYSTETVVFQRPADYLTSLCPWGAPFPGTQPPRGQRTFLFCNGAASTKTILRGDTVNLGETVAYTHTAPVRAVRLGPDGLYFSEAYDGAKDGFVYRFSRGALSVYCAVKLARIGGFWGGDFAFGMDGKLYLSNGNRAGAKVWVCPPGDLPASVYTDKGAIMGFCFTAPNAFVFTNGTSALQRASLGGVPSVIFTSPKGNKYSDVTL